MPSEYLKVLVVYNPAAQGGASALVWEAYLHFLEENKVSYASYVTSGDEEEHGIGELLELYQCSILSIVGGDGTINLTINALSHFNIMLHIIPAGSGNDLAKMIYPKGIPKSQQLFERVLAEKPRTITVDIWRCNEQFFINGFGCGFDGSIAYNTKYKKGIWDSKMKYWVEIVKHLFMYRSPTFSVNGKEQPTFMLSVANGQVYGGDFMVAPHADISDGNLEVVRIHKLGVLKRLLNLPLMKKGGHLNKDFVHYSKGVSVHIKSSVPLAAHLDGEPMNEMEYEITYAGKCDILV